MTAYNKFQLKFKSVNNKSKVQLKIYVTIECDIFPMKFFSYGVLELALLIYRLIFDITFETVFRILTYFHW